MNTDVGREQDPLSHRHEFIYGHFPPGFIFGSASSAYQCEGGWNADGKGESIWDRFCHTVPSPIVDKSTGDVATDSYHRYKEDVQLLVNMGAKMYRFSIAWTRILPDGTTSAVNQPGIDYYNALIDELLAYGIQPMITLFHWDLPQKLQDQGGWLNDELIIKAFGDYARTCFATFGDRVKYWATINEPYVFTLCGYERGCFAPGLVAPAVDSHLVLHNMLKAHAEAYHIYADHFKAQQNGKVGLAPESNWHEPADKGSPEDKLAAEQALQFNLGRLLHPIFKGGYPPLLIEMMDRRAKLEGQAKSRLPELSQEWIERIKGTSDFIGVNHYTTLLTRAMTDDELQASAAKPTLSSDDNTVKFHDPAWPGCGVPWLKIVPWGLRRCLNWIKDSYGNPEVMITENGICVDNGVGASSVDDPKRVEYYRAYINDLLKAIRLDGCNVTGYLAWCLADGFEWDQGYTTVFGIHHVDFEDPKRKRTPKKSAEFLKKLFAGRGFVKND